MNLYSEICYGGNLKSQLEVQKMGIDDQFFQLCFSKFSSNLIFIDRLSKLYQNIQLNIFPLAEIEKIENLSYFADIFNSFDENSDKTYKIFRTIDIDNYKLELIYKYLRVDSKELGKIEGINISEKICSFIIKNENENGISLKI